MSRITRVTLHDIARELDITAATVSRALNGHPAISASTKAAVKKAAKKLNYTPNNIASSLRLGKTRIIGVIIPSAEINFFGSVVHGIEKIASERNYNVLLYQSNELVDFEKKGIQTFLRSRVDGVLASLSLETVDLTHYRELKERGVPLILFDRVNEELGVPGVCVDDYRGAYMATEHLITQGCSRIAHIGGQPHIPIFARRLQGYLDALRAHNLSVNEDLISYGKISIESGFTCMQELLERKVNIDGLFAVEDFTALGAIHALKSAGKVIPDDVAVIGFANETFGEYITPTLSTVDQQTIQMGEEAARLFFSMSENKTFYKQPQKRVVLEPQLLFRQSSLKKK